MLLERICIRNACARTRKKKRITFHLLRQTLHPPQPSFLDRHGHDHHLRRRFLTTPSPVLLREGQLSHSLGELWVRAPQSLQNPQFLLESLADRVPSPDILPTLQLLPLVVLDRDEKPLSW